MNKAMKNGKTKQNVKTNTKTHKALKAAGIAAGAAAAASLSAVITTKCLVNVALDREPPQFLKDANRLVSGSQANEDFMRRVSEASERLAATPNETVRITAHDGLTLTGHVIAAEDPERVIIAMHGWRSSWHADFGMVADFWHRNNCTVLYAEQRGQNNSDGEYMGFGLTERFDCLDWVKYMNSRFGTALPVWLCGVSMGATTVLMTAGLDLPENVHGIIADCGFTSPGAIWKHVAEKNLHISYGLRSAVADAMCRRKILMGADDYSTVDALRAAKVPVMFIHGTDDRFVPISMTYENYLACASPRELLMVPGADHGMSYYLEKEKYEEQVLDFWHKYS